MHATIKQHYVPQMLLRNFALNGTRDRVACFRITDAKPIPGVHTKNIAHENRFYGTQEVENALGSFEGLAAPVIQRVIADNTLPAFRSDDHRALLAFSLLQAVRTPISANLINDQANAVFQAIVSRAPELKEAQKESEFILRYDNAPATSVQIGLQGFPVLLDLRCKLLRNRTKTPFILSDHPAVLYNQFLEARRKAFNNTGFALKGLQLLLPLAPWHCLVFFDPEVYKVGGRKLTSSQVDVSNDADVKELNILQAVRAAESLFFNDAISMRDVACIVRKATKYRGRVEQHVYEDFPPPSGRGEDGHLLTLRTPDVRTGLKLHCLTINPHAQKLVFREKNDLFRDPMFPEINLRFYREFRAGNCRWHDFNNFYLAAKAAG